MDAAFPAFLFIGRVPRPLRFGMLRLFRRNRQNRLFDHKAVVLQLELHPPNEAVPAGSALEFGAVALVLQHPFPFAARPAAAEPAAEHKVGPADQRVGQVADDHRLKGELRIEVRAVGILHERPERFPVVQLPEALQGEHAVVQRAVMVRIVLRDAEKLRGSGKPHLPGIGIIHPVFAVALQIDVFFQEWNPLVSAEIPAVFHQRQQV